MKKLLSFFVLIAALLPGGCFFYAPQNVTYYDLSLPPDLAVPGIQLLFNEFENFSGAGMRMRYRVNGNQQLLDSLNKWADTPENLLRQYLLAALTDSTAALKPRKTLTVNGRLDIFELNLDGREAILQFSYMLEGGDYQPPVKWRTVRAITALNGVSPAEFAKAFSDAAEQAAKSIRNDILNHHQAQQ